MENFMAIFIIAVRVMAVEDWWSTVTFIQYIHTHYKTAMMMALDKFREKVYHQTYASV